MALFPVGAPPGQKYEIEFTAGVWTDVSADVEFFFGSPPQIHFGRTSPFAQPGPASMTFTLRNELGEYTPFRQVLANGAAHPYWPNVVPRKRFRYSYTVAGVPTYRFFGYVKGWPPAMLSGVRPYVTITATDRMDQLSRVTMQSPIQEELTPDAPALWWPLTDPEGSTQAAQAIGGAYPLAVTAGPAPLTFGDNGPGVGDGPGVKFAPTGSAIGQYLQGPIAQLTVANYTVEVWINAGLALPAWGGIENILALRASGNDSFTVLWLDAAGLPNAVVAGGSTITGPASLADGGWHHIAVTSVSSGLTTLYVDGVSVATTAAGFSGVTQRFMIGEASPGSGDARFQGNIGQVAIYTVALSAARIAAHAATANGYSGDTTDQRIARYLGFAGLTAADWTLDAGQTTVGTYPQAGKSVVQACQDMATTEGGGAAFWVRPAGAVRFANRRYRDATTPVLTLDALVDLDATVYDTAYDETTLVNTSTASRSAESGTLSTQTYTDEVSAAQPPDGFGLADDGGVTTYTLSDQDALNLAQSHVAGNAFPGFRLDQVAANLHASTSSKYAALAAVEIGKRIKIANLPPGAAPLSTLDQFVEGWTEYPHPNTYRVVFDTSPVGTERMKLNATYGKLGCDGQTLSTALPNSPASTNVVIATAVGKPPFTGVSGEYPTKIKVGEEVITLPTAPGGATSPQTFTGCLRGQEGTLPAAQAAGSVITLWPLTGLAL
jgi:hypothetical protein